MIKPDMQGFFADLSNLDKDKYILVDYYFESLSEPYETAAHLCEEMSTIQWHRLGIEEDFRPEFGAKAVAITNIQKIDQPSSPFLARHMGWRSGPIYACEVKIAYPYMNFGTEIPNLLTAFCGEGVMHAPGICAIRWLDIQFPVNFLDTFQGPQFGVNGLRELLDIYERPFFFGVIKPNIGLQPKDYAQLAYEAWVGGLDVAMDDELVADAYWSRLEERSRLLGDLRRKAESFTGKKKMFQANITAEVDRLAELHDLVVANGTNAVMINSMTTGLSAIRVLRKRATVPLVSHFDLYGAMTQIPFHGVREKVFIKLQRMVGFDAILFSGFDARMKSSREDVLENTKACLEPLGNLKPALPIPAGSQWAGSLPELYQALGTVDFAIVPGRGIFEHPQGPEGGARSLHQGWEAVMQGVSLEDYARSHEELHQAVAVRKNG
jgi:ribulose-bisphosphate carboxylase large chain